MLVKCTPKVFHLAVTLVSFNYIHILPSVHNLLSTAVYSLTVLSRVLLSASQDLEHVEIESKHYVSLLGLSSINHLHSLWQVHPQIDSSLSFPFLLAYPGKVKTDTEERNLSERLQIPLFPLRFFLIPFPYFLLQVGKIHFLKLYRGFLDLFI
jgi:hypothetical protein